MLIEVEVIRAMSLGGYLIALATLLATIEFFPLLWATPRGHRLGIYISLLTFSYVGMLVGFMIGYTNFPGIVAGVLPALLTFVVAVLTYATAKGVGSRAVVWAGLMVSSFCVATTLFMFAGIGLRALRQP